VKLRSVFGFVGVSFIARVVNFGINSLAFWILINFLTASAYADYTSAMTLTSVIGSMFVGIQLQAVDAASRETARHKPFANFVSKASSVVGNRLMASLIVATVVVIALTPLAVSVVGIPASMFGVAMTCIPIALATTLIDGNLYGAGMSVQVQVLSVLLTTTRFVLLGLGLVAGANLPSILALQILGAIPMITAGIMMIPFKVVHVPQRINTTLIILSLYALVCMAAYSIDIVMTSELVGPDMAAVLIPALSVARVASLTVHLAGYFSAKQYLDCADAAVKTRYKIVVHLSQLCIMGLIAVGMTIPMVQELLVNVVGLSRESVKYLVPAMVSHAIWSIQLGSMPMRSRDIRHREILTLVGLMLIAAVTAVLWVNEPTELFLLTSLTGLAFFLVGSRAETRHVRSASQSAAHGQH